jgi:transposase
MYGACQPLRFRPGPVIPSPIRNSTQQSPGLDVILDAAKHGNLSRELAESLHRLGPEAVIFFALAMAARVAALQQTADAATAAVPAVSPSTPSGMVPQHQKPAVKGRGKKPGARKGHPGARRKAPLKIDVRVEHRLDGCPCCGGELQRCNRSRQRIIEDIPVKIEPVVTEHTIHRDYCPACKKHVEPVVPDAMPNATLGHHVIALSGWFHYGLGVTIGQVRDILASHLHTDITAGGLLAGWNRLAEAMFPWYEQVAREARAGAVLHADETGWRVDGQTWWLWCFCNPDTCYYLIDPSRGSPALQKFFIEAFRGTVVTDFWVAYESVCAGDNQKCLPHLLRELIKVDQYNVSAEWKAFSKQLKRLVRDGIRLRKRPDFSVERYRSRIRLINRRLVALADAVYHDADAARLGQRISRYRDQLFTFLDTAGVPPDNNHAERQIRPAVIIRKNSLCNRSEQGAATQAVMMSIFRTLKLRGHDPIQTIAAAVRELVQSGSLPPLPAKVVAEG